MHWVRCYQTYDSISFNNIKKYLIWSTSIKINIDRIIDSVFFTDATLYNFYQNNALPVPASENSSLRCCQTYDSISFNNIKMYLIWSISIKINIDGIIDSVFFTDATLYNFYQLGPWPSVFEQLQWVLTIQPTLVTKLGCSV